MIQLAISKYDRVIPPNVEKIKKWLSEGVAERRIAENLGISYSTWRKWKKENRHFSALFDNIEIKARVEKLENNMFKLANGYTVTLKKAVKVRDPGGGEHIEEYEEDVHVPPNFNALRFLLTNWSKEYSNDPALIRLREKEFEHKKEQDKLNSW